MLIDNKHIRLIIKLCLSNKEYEVSFSKILSLKENIKLFLELTEGSFDDYILLLDDGTILNIDISLKELNLVDGTYIYLYDFTN